MGVMQILWPIFFPLLGAIIAAIHIYARKYTGVAALEIVLMWQLAVGLGLSLLYGGIGHLFVPDQVAESIGWPVGSPFQREVGIWDMAMGIVGLLCLKFRGEFWIAMIAGAGLFCMGAGLGHVWELVVNGNTAPNNAGTVMYFDLLYPVFLVILLVACRNMYARTGNKTT
ncbi:MAG: DUF6790 family protein [Methanoregula sp.]